MVKITNFYCNSEENGACFEPRHNSLGKRVNKYPFISLTSLNLENPKLQYTYTCYYTSYYSKKSTIWRVQRLCTIFENGVLGANPKFTI